MTDASFGDGAEYVASSSDDGTARLWQGPTPIPSLRRPDAALYGDGAVPAATFTPAGNRIVIGGGGYRFSGQGRILDGATLHTQATFNTPAGQVLAGDIVSRTGMLIAAFAGTPVGSQLQNPAIDVFDARTGTRLATMVPGGGHQLVSATLNDAGTQLATLESGGRVELWDARSGRLLHVLNGATDEAQAMAFSHDGSLLAVAHDPALPAKVSDLTQLPPVFVQLWDTSTGTLERTIQAADLQPQILSDQDYAPLAVAFSPNGQLLALTGAGTEVQLFNPRTGATAHPPLSLVGLPSGAFAGTLAFSPNGHLLAAGTASAAYVWNVPSFGMLPVFQAIPADIAGVVTPSSEVRVGFTLDSRYLQTFTINSSGNTLDAWSIPDTVQVFRASLISAGSLSPTATQVVTTSEFGGVSVYPCQLCGGLPHLLALAKQRITRSFTPAERAQYLSSG